MTTATSGPLSTTSFGLDPDVKKWLDEHARILNRTRAEVIRMAIDQYRDRQESPRPRKARSSTTGGAW